MRRHGARVVIALLACRQGDAAGRPAAPATAGRDETGKKGSPDRMMPSRAAGAVLLAALLVAPPAAAQQAAPQAPNREVSVQNETDMFLRELYLAPPNAPDRGPDRLGAEIIEPGETVRLRLGRVRDCVFDVTAVFADDSEDRRRRVDICRTPRLVFGDPSLPRLEVTIANASPVALRELQATRSDGDPAAREAAAWGPDRLGAPVPPGATGTLRLRSRACSFDLRAVYDDSRVETRQGLDLCRVREVAFDRSGIPRQPRRSVVLANRHLGPVQQAFLSGSSDADWGPDRLGGSPLAGGDDTAAEMEGPCEADLRIVFANGSAEERRGVDICETTRIVLRPGWVLAERLDEEGPLVAEQAPATGLLRIRNAGPLPIVELYTVPAGGERGEDRLGADILPIGATLDLDPADPDACLADLVVVFRDGREVTRPGVEMCAGEEIEVK
jgi:hypothetical protein